MLFTPNLKSVYDFVVAMPEKPKAIVLHCGTNDLNATDENVMLETLGSVHKILEARGIKMIHSYILPRGDIMLTAKAEVINSRVVQMLAAKHGVYISWYDNFL